MGEWKDVGFVVKPLLREESEKIGFLSVGEVCPITSFPPNSFIFSLLKQSIQANTLKNSHLNLFC